MDFSAAERARRIRLVLFDVDGVLTDGKIWILPHDTPTEKTFEAKGFHAHDGIGMSLARLGGLHTGIITKRSSETVANRARALRMDYVYMGQDFKIQAVREIMQRGSFTLDQIAYVGDDVIDLPVMRVCGLAIAAANARDQVKAAAHYITPNPGGEGAGRDAIDFILQAHGVLDQCIEEYLSEHHNPPAAPQVSKARPGPPTQQ
jgi:3-deoxy-D-manno-octulosonate 8-phosphate phosphatase (KDO 8-P phosphatase)